MLTIVEIDADDRIAATVMFDLDDIDAAFEELDARYLAGEAAAHARTWSVISSGYAAINRRELPLTTPDWVNIDHRRGTAFAPGDLIAYLRARVGPRPDVNIYIEAVHRLTDLGAVVTHVAHGTSQEGFDAEWRGIDVFTVDGELVSRSEVFDEADLDAAIARFDQLSQSAPQLENAAILVTERFQAHFAAQDWDCLGERFWPTIFRVTIAVGWWARESDMVETPRWLTCGRSPSSWSTNVTRSVIATRGSDLVLVRITFSRRDEGVEAFLAEVLMTRRDRRRRETRVDGHVRPRRLRCRHR